MSDTRVLVVEDEPVVVRAAEKVLRPEGFSLEAVAEGGAALERLRGGRYDLVFLDLMLPGMSGVELLERLAARGSRIPVIATSGYASCRKVLDVFKAGAFDFLPKPFDADELLGIVRRAASFGGRAPAAGAAGERGAGEVYLLGAHSWARLEEGGTVTFGLGESFRGSLGASMRLRLPSPGFETVQGKDFAKIHGDDACPQRVWAPLSGRVAAANPRLEAEPRLAESDPFGAGWLIRVAPSRPDDELKELSLR